MICPLREREREVEGEGIEKKGQLLAFSEPFHFIITHCKRVAKPANQ